MNKVVTINLNNKAYQLEEAGYEALQKYLHQASARLHDNPDRDEIMADFEQAVAEKCDQHLNDHKTVVTEKEIKAIIKSMGPVEEQDAADKTDDTPPKGDQPRRLYLIKEGAIIGGVCTGLSAYFNLDVTVVRAIFAILTILTGGAWAAVYIVLMMVMPEARTPEEKAEARGHQFNAQELIDRAKQKYAELSDEKHWKTVAKEQQVTIQKASTVFQRLGVVVLTVLKVVTSVAIGLLTGLWATAMWRLVWRNGAVGLGVTDPWLMLAWLTSGYITILILLSSVTRLSVSAAYGIKKPSVAGGMLVGTIWAIALSIFITISLNNAPRIVHAINSNQPYIMINDGAICWADKSGCLQTGLPLLDVQ